MILNNQKSKRESKGAFFERLIREQEEQNKLLKDEEKKSEDSLLEHSFLYKGFLDEENFKSKIKEQFSILTLEGDLKVTSKLKETIDIPIYDNESNSESSFGT